MLEKWELYQATELLSGLDSNGSRLISAFASDYRKITGGDICTSCNGFEEKFKNFINKLKNMKNSENKNSGFVLNPMYDNITLHGSNVYFNNENLTDEMALELIEKHPSGIDLFKSFPANFKELKKVDESTEIISFFGKDYKVDEAKELFKKAKIDSKATTALGLYNSLTKATGEQKTALENLVNPSVNDIDVIGPIVETSLVK
ncbi:hypothetical protein [Flavobacterium psychrophilum]|uniref:hypothetical protein n=1 Tax=Flavobacterium psychrophilum TaxID=96345 RepID=UPI000B7C4939|nr:hypothetical protein [Flavobacterium psychrophilum]SNA77304.1 hypothetical protein FI070_30130 [Flavobacterium psychrophilum]